jgi:hypothetical protein
MKHTVVVKTLVGQDVGYAIATPKEILVAIDKMAGRSAAVQQLLAYAGEGYSVLIVSPGTIVSIDDTRRADIPDKFIVSESERMTGDFLVIKSTLTQDDFNIVVTHGI